MNTQPHRLIFLIVLGALLVPPADAQFRTYGLYDLNSRFTGSLYPPLQVGNKWTYDHYYENAYGDWWLPFNYDDFSPLAQAVLRIVLRGGSTEEQIIKRFTIEITHTEKIGSATYYVFSDVDYNWPPVPNFFFAGKKVRYDGSFSTGPSRYNDARLYKFSPHIVCPYLIPDYPLLQDNNQRGTLWVHRELWYADDDRIPWYFYRPPASLSQEVAASFQFSHEETGVDLGEVWFVTGYGQVSYDLSHPAPEGGAIFFNLITSVSAVIDGKEIEYSPVPRKITHVQPTSWGQVKARHGQGP